MEKKVINDSYEKILKDYHKIIKDLKGWAEDENNITKNIKDSKLFNEVESERYEVFNSSNLTEDYELGLRLYKYGLKTAFINQRQLINDPDSIIAVGEFFPNTFWSAVKQRSRWMAGIVFQGWAQYKWKGPFKTKYFLFKDRKVIFSALGAFLSNIILLYFLLINIINIDTQYFIVQDGTLLWSCMEILFIVMIWRLLNRFYFTFKWYGFWYALMSPFRLLMDNFINFIALNRTLVVFWRNRKQFSWDSTKHY